MRDELLSLSMNTHAEFRKFLHGVEYDKGSLIQGLKAILATQGHEKEERERYRRYCDKCGMRLRLNEETMQRLGVKPNEQQRQTGSSKDVSNVPVPGGDSDDAMGVPSREEHGAGNGEYLG